MRLRLPGPYTPAWALLETGAAAVFSLLSMLLISRVIGPDAAGIGTMAIAAFLLLDLACSALFTDALVQRLELERRHVDAAFTAQLLVGAAAGLALALAAPAIAAQAERPEITPLLLALAPLLPISALSGALSGTVLRERRYRLLSFRALVGYPAALLVGLTAAQQGYGPWAMILHQATATLVVAGLLFLQAPLVLRPSLNWHAIGELWRIAGPQVTSVVILAGRYRLFILALGVMVPSSILAVSNLAFRLLDSALAIVWTAVPRIALPRLSSLQNDRDRLAEAYGELAQLQALLASPIAIGIALTAPDLVQALMGPAWAEAADAARIAGLAAVIGFLFGDLGSLFVAIGRPRVNLLASVGQLAIPLALLVVLQPKTPTETAVCWAVGSVVQTPLLAWLVLRAVGRSPLWLLRRIAPALLATGAMAAAVVTLQRLVQLAPIEELALSAALGALVYGATAWLAIGCRMPDVLRHQAVPAAE